MSDAHLNEIWKPVVGYEGLYSVSNIGRVRSERRTTNTRQGLIRVCFLTNGYPFVPLCKGGKYKNMKVHRLVASAFIGPSELVVNHKNGIQTDNRVENLEWVTQSENVRHAWRVLDAYKSRDTRGEKHHGAKLTERDVIAIRAMVRSGSRRNELAKKFGVDRSTINYIVSRKLWKHVPEST